jgi:RNA polymerase sigma factor (sigma-70 family)
VTATKTGVCAKPVENSIGQAAFRSDRRRQNGGKAIGVSEMCVEGTTQLRRLMARLKAGDAGALEILLGEYRQRFVRMSRRMLGDYPFVRNAVETDDVVQGASLRLVRALKDSQVQDKILREGHVQDFLRLAAEMMRRELVDLARYYRKRRPLPLPEDMAARKSWSLDDEERFHEAVAELPKDIRAVFDLRYYNGLSTEETAEQLGVSQRGVQLKFAEARVRIVNACLAQSAGN